MMDIEQVKKRWAREYLESHIGNPIGLIVQGSKDIAYLLDIIEKRDEVIQTVKKLAKTLDLVSSSALTAALAEPEETDG